MAEGWVELHKDDLTSVEGINSLNRMLRVIFDSLPGDTLTVRDLSGYGSPENSVVAGIGSTYRCLDGGASTSFYIKEAGVGATGWRAV